MQQTIITATLLPIALGIIMLGLGLSLTLADFTRVVRYPKAIILGLTIQMLVLTTLCFGITLLFKLPPELAVGMMLLAASPGGATANIYSHLAHGDVALNITLTAVNSLLSLLALPFIVSFSLLYFMGAEQYVPPPFKKIIEVALIILIPVVIGMALRHRFPMLATKSEKPLRIFSVLLLAGLVLVSLGQHWQVLMQYAGVVGVACIVFNVVSMAIGYRVPLLFRLPEKQAIAIAMEIGIHNGTLAIFIALTILNNGVTSIPAAIYSFIMFVTASLFAWWLVKRRGVAAA
jgi:bile acid:Na+ symporter, BASS family